MVSRTRCANSVLAYIYPVQA
ncbi:unnamed protein product, partial [Allacma fusca]